MHSLRSGAGAVPKGFKKMLDQIGKKEHVKNNRDTLKRTLIEEEKRRTAGEDDEDIIALNERRSSRLNPKMRPCSTPYRQSTSKSWTPAWMLMRSCHRDGTTLEPSDSRTRCWPSTISTKRK